MILALKARKLLSSRCMRFLDNMFDPRKEINLMLDDVPVVRVYASVFLKDLPRLLPDWEITFSIEVEPGTAFISQAMYQLAPIELKELKV